MIELASEQRNRLEKGGTVEVTDSETSQCYVVLGKEAYERVRHLLSSDAEWGKDELRSLLARSAEANGWNEPEMDAYERYDEEIRKRCS